jgi:hypothetical protein
VSKLASPARYTFIDDVLGRKGIVDPSGKTRIVLETCRQRLQRNGDIFKKDQSKVETGDCWATFFAVSPDVLIGWVKMKKIAIKTFSKRKQGKLLGLLSTVSQQVSGILGKILTW